MRHLVSLLLTAALPQLLAAQTASQNYILSRRPLNTAGTAAIETVTYVDGLGRPVETVQKGAAPDGGDIVSMKEYDGLDREVRSWLPVPVGKGGGGYVPPQTFRSSAVGSYIYGGDVSPYSENVYEQSALGRIVRRHGPGKAWRDADSHIDTEFYANRADGLDRLENVDYTRNGTSYNKFATYAYDSMGNIRRLQRKGCFDSGSIGLIDDLKYEYDGNQLTKVTDWARTNLTAKDAMHFIDGSNADVEYEYDANGNMTRDLNRGIVAIKYNSLDLPVAIAFNNKALGAIKHTYLADGTRIRTDHISSSGNLRLNAYTEYHGNHIYENGLLSMTLFDGGFISYANGDASKPSFHYYVKDHLGSNRIVLADDGTVEQVNDYYPFGALMSNGWTNVSSQKYKYIGKELDRTFGYDMYDNGARWNNSILGRWETMDKLAEENYGISPYAVCHDNPFVMIDPNGYADYFSNSGFYLYSKGDDPNIYVKNGNSFMLFGDLSLRNKRNLQTGANIVGFYAKKAGVKFHKNGGTGNVGVSTMHEAGGDGVLAGTKNGNIYMKMTNGKLHPEMYNINNLMSTLKHENYHKLFQESNKGKSGSQYGHIEIIYKQICGEDFKKCTETFQEGMIGTMVIYMNEEYSKHSEELLRLWNAINKVIQPLGFSICKPNNEFILERR